MSGTTKTAPIVGGVGFALLVAVALIWGGLSGWQGAGWHMMGPWMMGGFGWGWLMPILMILFLAGSPCPLRLAEFYHLTR